MGSRTQHVGNAVLAAGCRLGMRTMPHLDSFAIDPHNHSPDSEPTQHLKVVLLLE